MKFSEVAHTTRCGVYRTQAGELRPPRFDPCEFQWDFPRESCSTLVAGRGWLHRPRPELGKGNHIPSFCTKPTAAPCSWSCAERRGGSASLACSGWRRGCAVFTPRLLLIVCFPPNKALPAWYLEINAFYSSPPGRHHFLLMFSSLYSLIKTIRPAECCCVCFKLLYLIIFFKPCVE